MSTSRASTVTVGRDDPRFRPVSNDNGGHASENHDNSTDATTNPPPSRLIIAVDFGTTYSAVSYVSIPHGASPEDIDPRSIRSIENFPQCRNFGVWDQMEMEVPTEIMYPRTKKFREQEKLDDIPHIHETEGLVVLEDFPGNNFGIDTMDWTEEAAEGEDVVMQDSEEEDKLRWGYAVHELWSLPSTHSDSTYRPLSRFKLLLDSSPSTHAVREELTTTLSALRRRETLGKDPLQVISDFLTYLLRHTQSELRTAGYDGTYEREIVISVPAIWTQKACRDMQRCLTVAMERAQFEGVDVQNGSIENLFIVSEPEAAAAYVLTAERSLNYGDVFVLLDAGGGTVDANTYAISNVAPLRLSEEVVPPGGGLHGSSYLNEDFKAHIHNLLASETYLIRDGGTESLHGIVEKILMDDFEYKIKRTFDCYHPGKYKAFSVHGLRDNPAKGFHQGSIRVPGKKLNSLFIKRFDGIGGIMEDQIRLAMERDRRVNHVVLIGGFAASRSLRTYLETRLNSFNKGNNCNIRLIFPTKDKTIVNAVASGAVLRALNKTQGPSRMARSSYGILRTEPYDEELAEHREQKRSRRYDPHDGQPYMRKTIDWVLKLGSVVPTVWTCEFPCYHTFSTKSQDKLLCKEVLYVSDSSTRSHYTLNHHLNAGAEQVGEVVVDFSYLRDEGRIEPVEATITEEGKRTQRHYKINYTMVLEVAGRDINCSAIYEGQVKKKCRVNIASGFRPGTE